MPTLSDRVVQLRRSVQVQAQAPQGWFPCSQERGEDSSGQVPEEGPFEFPKQLFSILAEREEAEKGEEKGPFRISRQEEIQEEESQDA